MHAQQHHLQQQQNVMPLQKPPKWLQKPAGANFGVSGMIGQKVVNQIRI